MTPRQYNEFLKVESDRLKDLADNWFIPLHFKDEWWSIRMGLDSMNEFKLCAEDVPLIIKLVENPKYKTSNLFSGAVDLFSHDCIHILLGRGLRVKDEAFVIGYTMGSAKKMKRWRRNLFMFYAKYLYPEGYKFGEEERFVFNVGVQLGGLCNADLTDFDFKFILDFNLNNARDKLGIDKELLNDYYKLEKACFPKSPESQRLLDTEAVQSVNPK